MRASELMTTDVASVLPEASRQEIARLLVARGISAVPVVESNGTPLGMVSEEDLIRRGEPERQQRRDWWLEMLAEGETRSEDDASHSGGREATARDLMSAPLSSWSRKAPTPRRSRPFSSRTGSNACLWSATGGWSASSAVRTCCGRSPADATVRIRVLAKGLIGTAYRRRVVAAAAAPSARGGRARGARPYLFVATRGCNLVWIRCSFPGSPGRQ